MRRTFIPDFYSKDREFLCSNAQRVVFVIAYDFLCSRPPFIRWFYFAFGENYEKFQAIIILFLLSGCQTNHFKDYYVAEDIKESDYISSDKPVKIIDTADLSKTLSKYLEKGYIIVGSSFFEEQWCPRALAVEVARSKKASLVIIESVPVKTKEINFTVAIPHTHTAYNGYNRYSYTTYSYQNRSYSVVYFHQKAFFLASKLKKGLIKDTGL